MRKYLQTGEGINDTRHNWHYVSNEQGRVVAKRTVYTNVNRNDIFKSAKSSYRFISWKSLTCLIFNFYPSYHTHFKLCATLLSIFTCFLLSRIDWSIANPPQFYFLAYMHHCLACMSGYLIPHIPCVFTFYLHASYTFLKLTVSSNKIRSIQHLQYDFNLSNLTQFLLIFPIPPFDRNIIMFDTCVSFSFNNTGTPTLDVYRQTLNFRGIFITRVLNFSTGCILILKKKK